MRDQGLLAIASQLWNQYWRYKSALRQRKYKILKGSGKIFQIKPQDVDVNGGLKELDANAPLQGPANIRGNIIHITVNNFITNSNLTTTPKKNLDNSHSIENTSKYLHYSPNWKIYSFQDQEKVTASPRNKKFMEQGPNSHRQNENAMERSEDLSFDSKSAYSIPC